MLAHRLVPAVLALGLLALSPLAPAQTSEDAPAPPLMQPPPSAPASRSLEQLRAALALTPEQLPLWQAYAGQLNAYTELHYREKPAQESDNARQQFARLVGQQQNRLAALEDIEGAADHLYALLTPAQRKIADQQLIATLPVFASAGLSSTVPPAPSNGNSPSRGGPPPDGMRQRPGGF